MELLNSTIAYDIAAHGAQLLNSLYWGCVSAMERRSLSVCEANIDGVEKSPVTLSAAAAQRVVRILADEPAGTALRVSVEGGGCSGFQYKFELVGERDADDLVLQRDGAVVLIDSLSQMYMAGAVIDFTNDLMGQAFKIVNPNAVASCGCGTSFSL